MTRHRTGPIGLRTFQVTGALVAAIALAGCGGAAGSNGTANPPVQNAQSATSPSTQAPPSSEPSGTAPSSGSAQPKPSPAEESTRCHTSMLSGSLEPGNPGAGQRYAELVLRNTSSESCTLYGYGGLQLIGDDGNPLPTDLERTPNPGPRMLQLAPDESASATLHWTAVPHGDEATDGPCQPTPASAKVTPPDETDPLTVDWDMGPVCGHGSIDGTAYHQ